MDLDALLAQILLIFNQLDQLWQKVRDYYSSLPAQELGMQIIAFSIVFIFLLSIILAITVVVLRLKNHLKSKRMRQLEEKWEKQLMEMIMSSDTEAEPPVPRRSERAFFVRYLYRFAERLLGAEREQVIALAKPYLSHLAKGLKAKYAEHRARTINMLGVFGFAEYIEEIRKALHDPSPIVSMTAARTLATSDYPEHCDLILPVIEKFDQWSMSFLTSMLSGMGSKAASSLRATLVNPVEPVRVRIACAGALREMGDLSAGNLAIEILDQESDVELKAALLRIIGSLGVARHKQKLIKLLASDEFIVRVHTLRALGQIGDAQDGEIIREAFDDESEWVSLHAARALLSLGRVDLLEAIAEDHPRIGIVRQVVMGGQAA